LSRPIAGARAGHSVYAGHELAGCFRFDQLLGVRIVQTAKPRDVAALALVVGMFLVLFIAALVLGSPAR
jgi:hypothetical protein